MERLNDRVIELGVRACGFFLIYRGFVGAAREPPEEGRITMRPYSEQPRHRTCARAISWFPQPSPRGEGGRRWRAGEG